MNPKILIPVDESETAQHTIGTIIANKDLIPREILLLHVVDVQKIHRLIPDIQKNMIYEAAEKSGNRVLKKLAKPFTDAGFETKLQLELGRPGAAIKKIVKEQDIQLVILGRHPGGGGVRDIMFGSVTNYAIRAVKCPILLC